MEQLNKVELVGIVGRTIVESIGDRKAVRLSLCTNRVFGGEARDYVETTWHNVTAFEDGKDVKDVESIKKGDKLHVLGRIRNAQLVLDNGDTMPVAEICAHSVSVIK